jgi:membrane protein implicated in regulation of membrane protease activity
MMELEYGILLLLFLGGFIFWLWMLIEALSKEKKDSDKIVWVLVILFASMIGALLYFFYRMPRRKEEEYLHKLRRKYAK